MTDAAIIAAMRSEMPDDTELRESLQHYGWVEEFPAIQDEHGTTLVGNRRLRIAAELGIKPVIKKITVGSGEAADATRFKLAIVSNLGGAPMSRAECKKLAEYLYDKRGWTEKRIADAIGRSQSTVRDYLNGLVVSTKPPRPKGGRPKAAPKRKYPKEIEDHAAKLVLDEGTSVVKAAKKLGISEQVVIRSKEREVGRREQKAAEPVFTRKDLSVTAQQKYDIAVRQHLKKLDGEFEDRVRAEHLRREDIWLNWELEEFRKAVARNYNYPGFMSKAQYRDLQRCLHTDTLDGIAKQGAIDPVTRKRFDDVLGLVIKLEAVLVKEDRKAPPRPTMEELMRRRAEIFAKRSAQSKASAAKRKQANGEATPG